MTALLHTTNQLLRLYCGAKTNSMMNMVMSREWQSTFIIQNMHIIHRMDYQCIFFKITVL